MPTPSAPYFGESHHSAEPGITGKNTDALGDGVHGTGHRGVVGESAGYQGVFGMSTDNAGVVGQSQKFHGVFGISHALHNGGVFGTNDANGFGVGGVGLIGVSGESPTGGLAGQGVRGICPEGDGVFGKGHRGVRGESIEYQGVSGYSAQNAGVAGESDNQSGVYAISHHATNAGLFATNDMGGPAAFFKGNVAITGVIDLLGGGDIAEDFDAEDEAVLPGSVMRLSAAGLVGVTTAPYDTAVVGIVAGASGFCPALTLDRASTDRLRIPITLTGKVMCLVDATSAPVTAGDLLTSSATPGHAMKALPDDRTIGTIVGKALRSMDQGLGLLPVLAILR